MKKFKFGIIGCQHGHISGFIKEMLELGYECAGIYEADNIALTKKIAETHQVPIVDNKEELLAEDISVIGSSAINNEKIDVIELCEKFGKHVMVDKPIVTSFEDYERLEGVIKREKIQVGMRLSERFQPALYTLKKQIDEGVFGKLVSIEARKPHRLTPSSRPDWHFERGQNGGIVVDLLIHDFDLLRWLSGEEIISANGYVGKNILPEKSTFYDVVNCQVVLESGVICSLYADWHTPQQSWTWGDCRVFVTGTKGCAEIRLGGDPFISDNKLFIKVTDEHAVQQVELESASKTLTADFIDQINGKAAMLTIDDVLLATKWTLIADRDAKKLQ